MLGKTLAAIVDDEALTPGRHSVPWPIEVSHALVVVGALTVVQGDSQL